MSFFTSSNKFLLKLPYDIMAIGNRKLYEYPIAYDMYKTLRQSCTDDTSLPMELPHKTTFLAGACEPDHVLHGIRW